MNFRLRKEEADRWFRHIKGKKLFNLDFDMYYFCLIPGLATRQRKKVSNSHTSQLGGSIFDELLAHNSVGVSMSREMEKLGVCMSDRVELHCQIRKLVDPQEPSNLSDEGMKIMNQYAHAGLDILSEWFDEEPRKLETFLPAFKQKRDIALRS